MGRAITTHREVPAVWDLLPPALEPDTAGLLRPVDLTTTDRERLVRTAWWSSWVGLIGELELRCRGLESAHGDTVSPGVLDTGNSGLLGPDAAEAYLALARRDSVGAHRVLDVLVDHLEVVLDHYRVDLLPELGPITSAWSAPGETHHGRWRVTRLGTTAGGHVAHKVRPVHGEQLFLAPGGIFSAVVAAARPGDRVRLPTLDVRTRRDRGGWTYSWAAWVPEPQATALDPSSGLRALVTTPASAADLWHDVGCLGAAVAAFGITDLGEENVVTADQVGHPALVPIDLEVYLRPTVGLAASQLVGTGHHHGGIEQVARPCTGGGPLVVLSEGTATARSAPCGRTSSRSLVLDGAGGAGHGGELPAFVRGLITTWLTICRARAPLSEVLEQACRDQLVRVLRRPTADYTDVLTSRLLGTAEGELPGLDEREAAQLDDGDVPYFTAPVTAAGWADRMTVSALGPAIRDAVEAVRATAPPVVTDARWGVSVHLGADPCGQHGCVSAEVVELGGRLIFRWDASTVRLELPRAADTPPVVRLPRVRERLLRLDRADTALRWTWALSTFTDTRTGERLQGLVDTAARWLDVTIAEHGWLGTTNVGADGAAAAGRLAQHLEGHPEVQKRALALLGRAAVEGEAGWAEVAGLTDALRLQLGLDQVHGTKFEWVDGQMAPVRLEDPVAAERARARLGLETLAEAAGRAAAMAGRLGAHPVSNPHAATEGGSP